ncbi:tetratricopeptide repeat protein [Planctomicrobium sp. SH664]|uniref:tetratricopeptide repeat protein n=1 Tax=Planctomicrobium sp. SH664 TaxID=3448125 RepID=UPI003F5B1142
MADEDRWAAECFRRGNDAINKQNWGLAMEMFLSCVKLKPQNLTYRQLLRQSTKKKYNDNGKGGGTFERTKLMGIRSRIKKAKTAGDWDEVSRACEEGFLVNPWDTQLNEELAEASVKLERTDIARFALMEACKAAPRDKALLTKLAELLRERREYDDAIKVWEQVHKLEPADMTASRKITELQTEKTTDRGGYTDAQNTRDVASNRGATAGRRGESVAPGQDAETDLRHAIRKEPTKIEHYLKLASHLKSARKFEDAYEVMKTAEEVSGNDPSVREQAEDYELLMTKYQLDAAKEKASASGSDEDRKQVAQMSIDFRTRRIEILTARVDRYPSNLNIKYELALLLMQLQKWSQAIPLLQKSAQDPRMKTKSLVALGKSFVYDKKPSLARGQFERALPDLSPENDIDLYKECYYLLGRICEDELGDKAAAEKYYGEIIVHDYDYKDARQRLEKLQSGGGA